jgi:hypothetical protein
MPAYEYRTSGVPPAYSRVPRVCLSYKAYVRYGQNFWACLKKIFCLAVCHRMRPCLKRIQPMPNVPLVYVSVYRRMSDIFYTLAYASTIRNSVTGPLYFVFISSLNHHARLRTCHHAGQVNISNYYLEVIYFIMTSLFDQQTTGVSSFYVMIQFSLYL